MDPVVASQDSESGIGRGTDQGKQLKAGPDGVLNWNGEDVWGFNVVPEVRVGLAFQSSMLQGELLVVISVQCRQKL